MAYFQRRRNGKIYVYYTDPETGKIRQVPRADTSHLDAMRDDAIHTWLWDWEDNNGVASTRSRARSTFSTDEIERLWSAFMEEKQALSEEPLAAQTLRNDNQRWEWIKKFFITHKSEKNLRRWYLHTPDFLVWLLADGTLGREQCKKVIWTLRAFGQFLVAHNYVSQPWYLPRLPRRNRKQSTPLKIAATPDQVLSFADHVADPLFRLALLLGYFGSLRPGELWGLKLEDFVTGDQAKFLAKPHKKLAQYHLGSGLSVYISRQKLNEGTVGRVKKYSEGWVNIWNSEAAKRIARILKTLEPGPIWPQSRTYLEKNYRRLVRSHLNLTPHDLRRASALYLGRTVGVDVWTLQAHMRHAEFTTTLLYCRTPDEISETDTGLQDFDNVD